MSISGSQSLKKARGFAGWALIQQFSHAIGLQAVQMGLSAVIGFSIIHGLSKTNYAIFSLLNVGISTFLGFSSMAVVSVFFPFARRNNMTAETVEGVIRCFRRQDRIVFIIGLLVTFLFWLFSAYQNAWLDIIFVVLMALGFIAAFNQYEYRLYESVAKVLGRPIRALSISVISECVRLALIIAALRLMAGGQDAFKIVVLASIMVICGWGGLRWIKKSTAPASPSAVELTPIDPEPYRSLMHPLWFAGYFYHFSQLFKGALVYWISGASVIAESAALGRLMMLFALLDKAVELVIIPRLGAIGNIKTYLRHLTLAGAAVLGLGVVLLASAWFAPEAWLWILGAQYGNVGSALMWAVGAAIIERLSGLILFTQLARGEARNQWWVPVVSLGSYLATAFIIGLDSVDKVTMSLFVSAVVNLVAQFTILALKLRVDFRR